MASFLMLKTTFDLTQSPKVLTFEDTTNYLASSIDINDVVGYIRVVSPSGIVIKDYVDLTPDITPAVSTESATQVQIPLLANLNLEKGIYEVSYRLNNISDDVAVAEQTFSINFTYEQVGSKIDVEYETSLPPYFRATDSTQYQIDRVIPTITRNFRLIYPAGTNQPDLVSTSASLSTSVFFMQSPTGAQHRVKLATTLNYSFSDFYAVSDVLNAEVLRNVIAPEDLCSMVCLIKAKEKEYSDAVGRNTTLADKFQHELTQMVSLLYIYQQDVKCGNENSAQIYLQKIKALSNCTTCGGSNSEGAIVQVVGVNNIEGGLNSVIGSQYVNVTADSSGDNIVYTVALTPDVVSQLQNAKSTTVIAGMGISVLENISGANKTYTVSIANSAFGTLSQILDADNRTQGRNIILNNANAGTNRIRNVIGDSFLEFAQAALPSGTLPNITFTNVGSAILRSAVTQLRGNNLISVTGGTSTLNVNDSGYDFGGTNAAITLPRVADVEASVVSPVSGKISFDNGEQKIKVYANAAWKNVATEDFVADAISTSQTSQSLSDVLSQGNNTNGQSLVLNFGSGANANNRIVTTDLRGSIYFLSQNVNNTRLMVESDSVRVISTLDTFIRTTAGVAALEYNDNSITNNILFSLNGAAFNLDLSSALRLPLNDDPATNVTLQEAGQFVYDTTANRASLHNGIGFLELAYLSDIEQFDIVGGTNVTVTEAVVMGVRTFTINSSAGGMGAGYSVTGVTYNNVNRLLTISTDEPNTFTATLDVTFDNVLTSGNTWSVSDLVMSYDMNNVTKKLRDADNASYFRFVKSGLVRNIELTAMNGSTTIQSSLASNLRWQNASNVNDFAVVTVTSIGTIVGGKPLLLSPITRASVQSPVGGMILSELDTATGLVKFYKYNGQNWIEF